MKLQFNKLTALAAAIGATLALGVQAQTLTVTSWGGAYTKSQVAVMHEPFTAKTGIKILSEDYNGGLAEISAQVKTGNVKWDVVDVELAEALRGCDEGLFEKIDASKLPKGADGSDAKADFSAAARAASLSASNKEAGVCRPKSVKVWYPAS